MFFNLKSITLGYLEFRSLRSGRCFKIIPSQSNPNLEFRMLRRKLLRIIKHSGQNEINILAPPIKTLFLQNLSCQEINSIAKTSITIALFLSVKIAATKKSFLQKWFITSFNESL